MLLVIQPFIYLFAMLLMMQEISIVVIVMADIIEVSFL